METIRLRAIQKPSHCEHLVEACVRGRRMVPSSAVRTTLSELSIPLRVLAQRNSLGDSSTAWLAWSEGDTMWFVAGTTSLEMSRERGRPVPNGTAAGQFLDQCREHRVGGRERLVWGCRVL